LLSRGALAKGGNELPQLPLSSLTGVRRDDVSFSSSVQHVLIADGDSISRESREAQLRAAGCIVSVARTGFEAIVKASCQVPDLIVLDESLPDIDAPETERLITTCPVTSHIPIISVARGRQLPRKIISLLRRNA
jgi:CheY-like chemotaxis protein